MIVNFASAYALVKLIFENVGGKGKNPIMLNNAKLVKNGLGVNRHLRKRCFNILAQLLKSRVGGRN